jgi:glutathione synthase
MSMKICFLINDPDRLADTDNGLLLPEAARALGHEVQVAQIDTLESRDGVMLSGIDLAWVLGLGRRGTFFDKIQLLKKLSQTVRVINSPEALFFLHSKTSQGPVAGWQYPETHISSSLAALLSVYRRGGDWVAKPTAASLGRGVFKLAANDPNAPAIMEAMTEAGGYCLLQRYVPEVETGEKRVLLAGGEVVGQYLKKPSGHRGNLAFAATPEPCDLTSQEHDACERLGRYLVERGAYFAGVDIAWPWFLEWNVVNPGGIGTIDRISGKNHAQTVIKRVLAPSQTTAASL